MAQTTVSERKAFQRQPARALLLDFHHPMNTSTCLNIHQALSSTLTLLQTISGPNRLPFLSIIVLGNYPECIFPLQPVKNNFPRLTSALNELKSLSRTLPLRQQRDHITGDCILEGIQEALAQYKRISQNYRPTGPNASSFPSQVELTLFTSRSPSSLRTFVERIADQLELENLKKISAVCLSDAQWMMVGCGRKLLSMNGDGVKSDGVMGETDDVGGDGYESQFTCSPSELGLSILDLVSIENDVLSLQNIFRSWLHDCSTDKEHLHLILPSPEGDPDGRGASPGGAEADVEGLVLKCDIQERVLDPSVFGAALGQQFSLQLASSHPPNLPPGGRGNVSSSTNTAPISLLILRVMAIVKAEGVCESVVFGVPLILRPTACWRLEWEELETNTQNMHALCQTLQEKGQMLVARAEHTSSVSPHFLILPSATCTLLVKPVAVGELLLPIELTSMSEDEQPTTTAVEKISRSMAQLENHESYNPLLVQSGLHEVLTSLSQPHSKSNLSRRRPANNMDPGGYHQQSYQREAPSLSTNQRSRGSRGPPGSLSKNLGSSRRGHQNFKGKLGF